VEGLVAGERVVVAGQYRLTQGAAVDPHELKAPLSSADKEALKSSQKAP
jgi:hypothetical protein